MKRKICLLLALVMVLSMLFAGCANNTTEEPAENENASETPAEGENAEEGAAEEDEFEQEILPEDETDLEAQVGGTLTIGFSANIKNLDPFLLDSSASNYILCQIGDTLLRVDQDGRLIPNLATEWTISEDRTEYTFTIRDDVYFAPGEYQDGRKMTVEDVAWNLNRSIDYYSGFLSMLKSAEVVDDTHVKCTLHEPNAGFLENLNQNFTVIVPPEEVEGWGDDFTTHVVATGAFMLESHEPDQQTVLVRNPNYWGPEPNIEKIIFKVIPDSNQIVNALLSGEIDIAMDITGEGTTLINDAEGVSLYRATQPRTALIGMNMNNEILSNPDVRKAIIMATDYETIVKGTYQYNEGTEARVCVPLTSWAYNEAYEDYVPAYDPEAAKELLAEAGYPDGFEITLTLVEDDNRLKAVTIFQQLMKANLNVDVVIDTVESTVYMEMLTSGTLEMWASSQTYSYDPYGSLGYVYATEKIGSNFNAWGYSNEEVDALLKEAASLDDEAERLAIYDQVAEIAIPANVAIWYSNESYAWGVSDKVHNLVLDYTGYIKVADATHNVWIEH